MAIRHFTRARFEAKIARIPEAGCWIWEVGRLDRDGYGYQGHERAHRVAWELFFGPIPEGRYVLHHCDVRCCVNPSHLFLGHAKENAHDAASKGRHAFGERHGMSKLTESQVKEILALRHSGVRGRAVAKMFGVTPTTISDIFCGRNWSFIKRPY